MPSGTDARGPMAARFVVVGMAVQLRAASARHHITLRHRSFQQKYHSLLLFSFPKPSSRSVDIVGDGSSNCSVHVSNDETADEPGSTRFYCMEAACPHLGAPLENASIYDVEDEEDIEDAVIVCPWHEYDFSLRTGESSTGLKACVYAVEERSDGRVYIQEPALHEDGEITSLEDEAGWDVVEVRPVSEAATRGREAAARQLNAAMTSASLHESSQAILSPTEEALPIHAYPALLPKTLTEWAVLILNTPEPRAKVELTRRASHAFRSGECRNIGGGHWEKQTGRSGVDTAPYTWECKASESPPETPPRLSDAKVVQPGREHRRGKGGSERSRIAMLHSLANIEQWAIDLAWDIIARAPRLFAERQGDIKSTKKLPLQFYTDWVKVAQDESKHFTLLQQRLEQMGARFGDLPVHHGLWESAKETRHSLEARLCIIHLVHEARGLDANPLTIKKFDNAGDQDSVEILTTIHLDEVTHVSAGHRWLTYLCDQTTPRTDPVQVFRDNVRRHFVGKLKGPFNSQDRTKAGLTKDWYENLAGEKEQSGAWTGVRRAEVPGG